MAGLRPDARFRPDGRFDDPRQLTETLLGHLLPVVARPARYLGGELGAGRPGWRPDGANLLLAFPDAYEIGTSHTGLRILYSRLAGHPDVAVDLAFTPWPDLEERMRAAGLPLFGLQSRRPARQFDLLGFSLAYELCYTNLLTMIDLTGIPLLAAERGEGDPLVVAGGACTLNPAVVGPFLDLAFLGDGEQTVRDIADAVVAWKRAGGSRAELCERLAGLEGAWRPGVGPVTARVLPDLNRFPLPDVFVPMIEAVHDRLSLEVMRGCARGCRFCQAGMVSRPVRERDVAPLVAAADHGTRQGGWDELSLLSLSSSDYSALREITGRIRARLDGRRVNLVLPSLRLDSVGDDLFSEVSREAPASFTFAPEAGSQRLRDVVNKQLTESEILGTARQAFAAGAKSLKLYFMIGLPTETETDLDAILDLLQQVVALAPRGGSQITVSVSPFAPKPHTPFQWAGQISRREMARRNDYLGRRLARLRVKVSLRDPEVSALEALLGLGDEKVARAVLLAWQAGARFDGWTEKFAPRLWADALATAGVDPRRYLDPRDPRDELPWQDVRVPVTGEFLAEEWDRALAAQTSPDCRLADECHDCGACEEGLDHRLAAVDHAEEGASRQERAPAATAADEAPFDPRNARPADPRRERRQWTVWRQQAAAKCWYRAEYTKEGDLCFLGHLDFQRQLQLALRRSGLPVAFSRGYHPHPLLKFGPPLPVGVAGDREVLDVAFAHEVPGWEAALNEALPPGSRIRRSLVVGATVPRSIDLAAERQDYRVVLPGEAAGGIDPAAAACLQRFLASESWPHVRQRPKGDVEVDARSLVPSGGLCLEDPAGAGEPDVLVLRVSLTRNPGGVSLPIHDFLAALFGAALAEPRLCRIRRTGYCGRSPKGEWRSPLEEVGEASRLIWLRKRMIA